MKELPKPNDKHGYPTSQLNQILKTLNITQKDFNRAFGINTVMLGENGETIHYVCDVERALWKLGHKLGKYHLWD